MDESIMAIVEEYLIEGILDATSIAEKVGIPILVVYEIRQAVKAKRRALNLSPLPKPNWTSRVKRGFTELETQARNEFINDPAATPVGLSHKYGMTYTHVYHQILLREPSAFAAREAKAQGDKVAILEKLRPMLAHGYQGLASLMRAAGFIDRFEFLTLMKDPAIKDEYFEYRVLYTFTEPHRAGQRPNHIDTYRSDWKQAGADPRYPPQYINGELYKDQ